MRAKPLLRLSCFVCSHSPVFSSLLSQADARRNGDGLPLAIACLRVAGRTESFLHHAIVLQGLMQDKSALVLLTQGSLSERSSQNH
eukprot:825233-Amphidinium_carterae.1